MLVRRLLIRPGSLIIQWKYHFRNCSWENRYRREDMVLYIRLCGGRRRLLSRFLKLILIVRILSRILLANAMPWKH